MAIPNNVGMAIDQPTKPNIPRQNQAECSGVCRARNFRVCLFAICVSKV
jgi:hypothetical protein